VAAVGAPDDSEGRRTECELSSKCNAMLLAGVPAPRSRLFVGDLRLAYAQPGFFRPHQPRASHRPAERSPDQGTLIALSRCAVRHGAQGDSGVWRRGVSAM
jgi:hypothetical protein